MRSYRLACLGLLLASTIGACTFDTSGVGPLPDGMTADQPRPPDQRVDGLLSPDASDGPRADLPQSDLPGSDVPKSDLPASDLPKPIPDTRAPDTFEPDLPVPDTLDPCAGCDPVLGCNKTAARCNRLRPATVPSAQVASIYNSATSVCVLDPGSSLTYSLDSTQATLQGCTGFGKHILPQGPGRPELLILTFDALSIGANARIRGTGDRAVLLYARRTIAVAGKIDFYAAEEVPGPGGKAGGSNVGQAGQCWFSGGEGSGGKTKNEDHAGGGGGAWGQDGAKGGDGAGQHGGAGGSTSSAPSSVVPLFGGCGGGAGGGTSSARGRGGAGGGALHLAAGESITISGAINAGGGGGDGGHEGGGGGGAGSGGTLFLEAPLIVVSGVTAANGGAGGGGGEPGTPSADDGDDGLPSASAAQGGASTGSKSAAGGNGGIQATAPKVGADGSDTGGGGGGGHGRIHFRAATPQISGVVSPTQTSDNTFNVW